LGEVDAENYRAWSQQRLDAGLKTLEAIVVDKDKIWTNPADTAIGRQFGKGYSEPRVPANCKWS
jgi:hypothetical protein